MATTATYHPLTDDGLKAYRFNPLKGTEHAVFTRWGGVSQPPWHRLNFSRTVGDTETNVRQNFGRACAVLAIKPQQIARCQIIHGDEVLLVKSGAGYRSLGQADAMITQTRDVFLFMAYADCVPLLFYDETKQAIGLAHAGWRGTMKAVMSAVIEAMQKNFGCHPTDLRVVIGPSIGPCCYQVQQNVLEAAQQTFSDATPFFRHLGQTMYFDLWQANIYLAAQAGVAQVNLSGLCTACRRDDFFSYRAENQRTGRFGVFLGLPTGEIDSA